MKKARLLSLLLLLAMLIGVFASCDNAGGKNDGGDRVGDSWEGVDFEGQEVNFCISVNQYEEATFPAADIYTRGPDTAGSNEVAKEVLARNAAAEKDLGVKIMYSTRDLTYNKILDDVKSIVMTSAKDSPDIYNNDLNGLSWAMAEGCFWNVKNPGEGVKNYFDFKKDGWYEEYIKCMTFDQEKLYIVAGDYFIDMIRMAWVVYVNHDILQANANALPQWAKTVDDFYATVEAGYWDMDDMIEICAAVHSDGGLMGITERNDPVVGLTTHQVTHMVYPSSSGITLYYLDKANGYKACVISDIDMFQKLANKYTELTTAKGVFMTAPQTIGIQDNTIHFTEGNVLFATQRLGEMESSALRDFQANKGLVPIPKWNSNAQEDYHTVIHNQVELAAILNTAKTFSASSALLQYLNENSKAVVNAYYEKGLKYKYNSDKNARAMMDLIRECTDDPFSLTIGRLCEDMYTGTGDLKVVSLYNSTTIASTFAAEKDAYNDCMNKVIEKFKNFD